MGNEKARKAARAPREASRDGVLARGKSRRPFKSDDEVEGRERCNEGGSNMENMYMTSIDHEETSGNDLHQQTRNMKQLLGLNQLRIHSCLATFPPQYATRNAIRDSQNKSLGPG